MLRVTAGHDIEYPLRSAGSAVAYYLKDGKEPPGAWAGTAAGALGLTGQVDPEVYRALAAPKTARRTTRAGSLAREVAASSALLLYETTRGRFHIRNRPLALARSEGLEPPTF